MFYLFILTFTSVKLKEIHTKKEKSNKNKVTKVKIMVLHFCASYLIFLTAVQFAMKHSISCLLRCIIGRTQFNGTVV